MLEFITFSSDFFLTIMLDRLSTVVTFRYFAIIRVKTSTHFIWETFCVLWAAIAQMPQFWPTAEKKVWVSSMKWKG